MIRTALLASGLFVGAGLATLPIVAPPAALAAETVSPDQIAENYAKLLEDDYVYADIGKRYADALRAGIASGRFAKLTGEELARALETTVQSVSPDGHIRVRAGVTAPPPGAGSAPPMPAPIEQAGWIAPGIAYIRFNGFPHDDATTAAAAKFMADHADAKAIIYDIRTHNGGGMAQMDAMFPWLFDKPTRLVTMAVRASVDAKGFMLGDGPTLRRVKGDPAMVTREHWVMPNEDKRLRDAEVYLLTSGASRSAAEHFALSMKHTGRAKLIGAATGGANHFGGGQELGGDFGAFIPVGRTYDPVTGKDWEGDGVQPDVDVAPERALEVALTDLGIAADEAKRLSDAHMPTRSMERRKPKVATTAK
ncbi:S41 family peptidase [Sphingopyxis sp. XHP0097]|uniref:S41 family peptidase n=1 Tax=Sphingopyxis jiangsuensis TaxID=2871171 RepID=A0ABS7MHI0_9SPHN|nr:MULTISPECIES: S41 family peptidase [Sphingopyxis]MBY4638164.1 S41 family peptidase [Sphingopyxis jiangsuensis]